ncbi:Myb-binding protein 1A [Saguinus oedipus]|uniref:Myb-binding protein 1A n=1 Tax=Saguinus oedipus TaxID=9490 RepID=A0ABQ9V7E0_SAGOE|nr:Myb-binding protein 1A [Saguinus oedipus]
MEGYVGTFLEGCWDDPEQQLAKLVAFSTTNHGLPVVPTFWWVVRFLRPQVLQGYVAWLQGMFLQPDLDSLIDLSTNNPKKA